MSKLTLKQVVKGLFDALNAKKADRSDLEGLATASDVEDAKEEIISNEDDFRTALMGKDGYLAIRPMFGIVINNTQTDTQTISHIYTTETQPSTYQLQDFQNTEEELDALERIDYKIPVPGTTYYFPKGVFSGIELLEPASGGLRTYYVPTAAPLNILTTDGQGNETLNYDGLELLELGRGSRVKCLKEVKYYNHTTEGTVKDDDESGIDYAHTEGYTYILSVYVYEADAEGTEISLNDIDELIGVPATGQPSTLFAAVAAGGSSDTSQAILAAVKDGNYTAIGMLRDSVNGLSNIAQNASSAASSSATASSAASSASAASLTASAIDEKIGEATDTEATSSSLFAWVKKLRDYLNGIVNTAPYAKESSVKTNVGGTDYTAIGELRDNNHGLSALLAKLAQIIADIGTIQTETEILSLPNAARIDIVTPEQSSGAISNLQIHANVMYHLGDLTALSLIMVEPSDLTIYNEFVVCFFCQTGFTMQITHWDANTQVLFNSGATCEAGHYYILSVVDNLALLAKF